METATTTTAAAASQFAIGYFKPQQCLSQSQPPCADWLQNGTTAPHLSTTTTATTGFDHLIGDDWFGTASINDGDISGLDLFCTETATTTATPAISAALDLDWGLDLGQTSGHQFHQNPPHPLLQQQQQQQQQPTSDVGVENMTTGVSFAQALEEIAAYLPYLPAPGEELNIDDLALQGLNFMAGSHSSGPDHDHLMAETIANSLSHHPHHANQLPPPARPPLPNPHPTPLMTSQPYPAASHSPNSTSTSTSSSNKRKATGGDSGQSPGVGDDAEPEEKVLKRQRNTMAARKYRQKRLDRISDLEKSLEDVSKERDELRIMLARREAEVQAMRDMLGRK